MTDSRITRARAKPGRETGQADAGDERPMLRDREGRVLAQVEVWRPFDAPN